MADSKEQRILDALKSNVAQVIDVDRLCVALLNKVTLELDFPLVVERGSDGLALQEWASRAYLPDKLLPDCVLGTGQSVLIEDGLEGWLGKRGLAYLGKRRPRFLMAVPMKARDDVLGVVVAEHWGRERAFDQRSRTILTAMVDRVTSVIANARLVENLTRVGELGQRLTSGIRLSETEIVEAIFQQMGELMNVDNAYVALYDSGRRLLRFPLFTIEGERVEVFPRPVDLEDVTSGGLTEVVLRTEEPLRIGDVAAFGRKWGLDLAGLPIPKSWLGVPMKLGDQILGIISVQNDSTNDLYGQDDQQVFQALAGHAAVALHNARLYYDVDQRLAALVAVGRAQQTEETMIELIYEQAGKLMDTRSMYIALYDQESQMLSFPLNFSEGVRESLPSRPVDLADETEGGLTEIVLRTKEPLRIANVDAYCQEKGIKLPVEPYPKSWMGVPMVRSGRLLGIISLQNDDYNDVYRPEDESVLTAMARSAALALDNAVLVSQVEKRRSQMATARSVANTIASELDPQACMERILDELVLVLEADFATIQLVDERTHELVLWAQRGVMEIAPDPGSLRMKLGEGITGVAALEDRTIRTGNVSEVDYYRDHLKQGIQSQMATPLKDHGVVVGVLNVEDRRANHFDQDDQALFELLAEQVVVAVQNARRIAAEFEEQARQAEKERLQYLGMVAGGVAHRIGSRSGLVRLNVRHLRGLISPEQTEVHALLDEIASDNEYLIELSEGLFIPAEAADTPVSATDVNALLVEATRRANIPSDVCVPPMKGQVPPVMGSRWLVEVFVELITNAVRAMSGRADKKLIIRAEQADKDSVKVLIEDTGCGIAPEELPKVFDLFYTRGRSAGVPARGGYGLWYCRSVVAAMGGDLQIESTLGQGTTCMVLLVIAAENP